MLKSNNVAKYKCHLKMKIKETKYKYIIAYCIAWLNHMC